jgi:clorobiocin/coumermycin A biosynthesis protein CloN6/CouN6
MLETLPRLQADLILIHVPAFFDFRNRRDIYFPFLGTSGDVPITPLYEYFPIGFKMLQKYLESRGYRVAIVNLSTILLRYPNLDVTSLLELFEARLIGIDLHWMVHVQGSIAFSRLLKKHRPDIPIVFGGISSTYYADELMTYDSIDMVLAGYDTLAPMDELLRALKQGSTLERVPNLWWKAQDGTVYQNGFTHKPRIYGIGVDWGNLNRDEISQTLPILEFLSTQNAGCAYNCGWCGGSREAFGRVFQAVHRIARKSAADVAQEFESLLRVPERSQYHFYAVGSYNEPRSGLERFLELVGQSGVKSISYEQFQLTPEPILRRMAEANPRTSITLSPESHDLRISKLSGRGVYTNEELERWIPVALDAGIHNIDIWYFIGMPEQDAGSVSETVDYCERLLRLFKGRHVNPMICPMIPFLDPASTFFEHPEQHGYRVFHRSVEQHRAGMERASLINRINYETQWLSREELVYVSFRAIQRLMWAKAESGFLPQSWAADYNEKIEDALGMIAAVHEADSIDDLSERKCAIESLGDEIERRNRAIFHSGVANQAFPVNRQVGGRWFDEMGWTASQLENMHEAVPSHKTVHV